MASKSPFLKLHLVTLMPPGCIVKELLPEIIILLTFTGTIANSCAICNSVRRLYPHIDGM